jgi:hypothetical protein
MGRAAAALLGTAAAIALTSGALAARRRIEDRRHSRTGSAEWIWCARAGPKPKPLRFYAFRDVELAAAPARVRALFFVDPQYVLRINGRPVASGTRRPGDPLAVTDLTPHLRAGVNRIGIEAASPDGIGGILFAVEGEGVDPAAFASGRAWRVAPDPETAARGESTAAVVWGRPPQYPWGYPLGPGETN